LLGDEHDPNAVLRADARALDASYQALVTTVKPLQRTLFGMVDETVASLLRIASASRHYGRNLVADLDEVGPLDVQTRVAVARGSETLRRSLNAIGDALNGIRDASYTRSFSLFDQAERRLEESFNAVSNAQLAIRDLMLLDQTMAGFAASLHVTVTDYDTVRTMNDQHRIRGPSTAASTAKSTITRI